MICIDRGKYYNVIKKIIIYGCGGWLDYRIGWFLFSNNVIAFSDKDIKKKIKIESLGYNYILPEEICKQDYDNIIVTSELYYLEIVNELNSKYNIPAQKIISGIELWNNFESICDGVTRISFGNKNNNKIFYVIAPLSPWFNNGLINLLCKIYHNICYAIEHNYIPIVDMKNFYTIYHEKNELGKINIWEKYFILKYYSNVDLDEVYNSKNVIFCFSTLFQEQNAMKTVNFTKHRFVNYIDENDYIKQEIEDAYSKIFKKKEHVLGVAIRGGDYNLLKPKGHHIQPTLEQIKHAVDNALDQWDVSLIYVVTEEKRSLNYMKEIYGKKIVFYECPLYDSYAMNFNNQSGVIGELRFERKDDAFLRGKEYFISTMLLTYCDYFISGITSKTFFLFEDIKVNFKEAILIDLGKY